MNLFRTAIAAAALAGAAFSADFAAAEERWVDIVNEGSSSIYSVHITRNDDTGWGRDLLGRYLIPAGDEMRVEPDNHGDYCFFDVKITYATGEEMLMWDVDLCDIIVIYTDGYYADVDFF
jgi:hypothetical protein